MPHGARTPDPQSPEGSCFVLVLLLTRSSLASVSQAPQPFAAATSVTLELALNNVDFIDAATLDFTYY
eukprot:scaffold50396_cov41-Phaeocystis_antarctica.AAC.1